MVSKVKYFLHFDMDAFFAAVEQRDHPQYKGKPICIGASPKERGVVSTCSYEARVFGIHFAMPSSKAYQLCPHAIFISPDHRKYSDTSKAIFSVLKKHFPKIEQMSVDEGFIDLSGMIPLYSDFLEIGRFVKGLIYSNFSLTCSVGIARNRYCAKIASDLKKPDGFLFIPYGKELDFFLPLLMRKFPGVGKKSEKILDYYSIKTYSDLLNYDIDFLVKNLGHWTEYFYFKRFLEDKSYYDDDWSDEKSISTETTFDKDVSSRTVLVKTMNDLLDELCQRLVQKKIKTYTIAIKIRDKFFVTYQKQVSLKTPTQDEDLLKENLNNLFFSLMKENPQIQDIRLIGVRFSNLEADDTNILISEKRDSKKEIAQKCIMELNIKYGKNTIKKGNRLNK